MSKYTFQEIPFRQAYIHGLIFGKSYWRENVAGGVTYVSLEEKKRYDAGEPVPSDVYVKWEKMSKSKGNVIDPMELIAQYGCDTTRMTLCSLPNSRQIDLDLGQFQDKQRFMTKIWNGASFVLGNIGAAPALTKESLARGIDPNLFTVEDFWIFSRLQAFARDLNQNLEGLQFDRVAYDMYQFFWNEFCSTYLELSKSTLHSTSVSPEVRENKQKVLVVVLDNILRLFHPTIPFITEELFGHLKGYFSGIVAAEGADPLTKNTLRALSAPSIVKAAFPQEAVFDGIPDRDTEFTTLVELSKKISQVLGASDASHTPSTVYIQGDADDWLIRVLRQNQHFVTSFNRKATLVFIPKEAPIPAKGTTFTIGSVTVSIAVPEETMHKQVALLQKKRDALQNQISGFNVQLASESFLVRAPQKIVEDTRSKRAEFVRQLNEVVEALQKLQ